MKHKFRQGIKFVYCVACYQKWDSSRSTREQMIETCPDPQPDLDESTKKVIESIIKGEVSK
jgi:hypothetical protein